MSDTLIIECSTPQASVARADEAGGLDQRHFTSDRNHNACLFGPLQELLAGAPGVGIDRVLVGTGPGSYSGTRVGIAAAQGVAIARQCPAVGIPSIFAVPSAMDGAPCLAIGDARRGSFWTAVIRESRLVQPPQLGDAASLEMAVAAACDDGVPVIAFEEAGRFAIAGELQAQIRREFPDAGRLWQAWQSSSGEDRAAWSAQIPQPIYLKPPHITQGKRPRLIE